MKKIRVDWKVGSTSSVPTSVFVSYQVSSLPEVARHAVSVPRIAVVHTWSTTQSEGWVRLALDELQVPFDYLSVHDVRDEANLRAKYDVILMGPTRSPASILQGIPKTGKVVSWKKTDITPNIGRQDETDDMRGGLEYEGLMHLRDFVHMGGVFITLAGTSQFPIHYGLTNGVSVHQTNSLPSSRVRIERHICRSREPDQLRLRRRSGNLLQSESGLPVRRRRFRSRRSSRPRRWKP